ncbi:MAG: hypothetical protein KGJ23_07940 [Euryarchaeota archaeon]|nr:hypothetical protein [Euryarchaeota archaeon]MDE1836531.1 hypothetical protein [Euryarchaeota archaeon]MDE1879274.1 hypothetical protein [Euryarchaeota archaeon]MDE2044501.1 hypothetical protein [Thermoplasmata archaeon]
MSDRILRQTSLFPGDESTPPFRIVLWTRDPDGRLATHMQVEPGERAQTLGTYRVWGHYHGWDNLAADKDFEARMRDYDLAEVTPPDATLAPPS